MAFGFNKHFAHGHHGGFGRGFDNDFYYAKRGGGRNPFGGNPFERGGGGINPNMGRGGGGGRFFRRGDIKFALLGLLVERPMHGYEMMKALEAQSGGMYTPSAGTIYPTLQLLEDRGFVTATESEGKKVYSITDAGRAELNSQKDDGFEFGGWGNWGDWGDWGKNWNKNDWNKNDWRRARDEFRHSPDFNALKGTVKELVGLTFQAFQVVVRNPAKLPQFRDILQHTAHSLSEMINNPAVPADSPKASASEGTDTPASKESAPPTDL